MENNYNLSFDEFYAWASQRETFKPVYIPGVSTEPFWAWQDGYDKGVTLLKGLEAYFQPLVFKKLVYNLALHYCITQDFTLDDGTTNPLYIKYGIAEKGQGIISHASDVSSSVTRHITDAMQKLDFVGLDLISTPYGKYAYSLLYSVNITPVVL